MARHTVLAQFTQFRTCSPVCGWKPCDTRCGAGWSCWAAGTGRRTTAGFWVGKLLLSRLIMFDPKLLMFDPNVEKISEKALPSGGFILAA